MWVQRPSCFEQPKLHCCPEHWHGLLHEIVINRIVVVHPDSRIGKIEKDPHTELWWSKDKAGHGGSKWKVFEKTKNGLEWVADANEQGDFLQGKHKSDFGRAIPWKDVRVVK